MRRPRRMCGRFVWAMGGKTLIIGTLYFGGLHEAPGGELGRFFAKSGLSIRRPVVFLASTGPMHEIHFPEAHFQGADVCHRKPA
jgi:hypothetical protein